MRGAPAEKRFSVFGVILHSRSSAYAGVINARCAFHFSDRSQWKRKRERQLTRYGTRFTTRRAASTSLRTSCSMIQACIVNTNYTLLIQKYPLKNSVQKIQKNQKIRSLRISNSNNNLIFIYICMQVTFLVIFLN